MILHLVPYEKVYLSTTMDTDESTAILALLKECNSADSTVVKFIHLLEDGISRAAKYTIKKESK